MTAETIPNAKPLIVEDAFHREVWPLIGHYPHPDDPTGRTALCGVKIYGCQCPGAEEFAVCADCQALRMADGGRTAL